MSETKIAGVDILLCGQWPLEIIDSTESDLDTQKTLFHGSSSSLRGLCAEICPRYIYSSAMDRFEKAMPYLNGQKFITRFVGLGDMPGRYKPEGSKTTYI